MTYRIETNKLMGIYPNQYTKEKFLKNFLTKNNVSEAIIDKFLELPEQVTDNNDQEYDIYINVVYCSAGNTSYSFEFNYYSEDLVEYLFNSKVFNDIEVSINYLLCELINNGFITFDENCNL